MAQHFAQPVQQGTGAQVGPGSNFNAVNVQVKTDNTALWVLLAVIFACPLMCVGMMALALLPYTMMGVGAILFIWGYLDYSRYRNNNWQVPSVVLVKMWGGAITAMLGFILWIFVMTLPKPAGDQPSTAPSRDGRPAR